MLSSFTRCRMVLSIAAVLFATVISPAQSDTAPYFVFVSADGSDTNACTRTAPCREVSRALDVVTAAGTVMIIRSGEYTGFAITKNVSIIAEKGVTATIVGGNESAVIEIGNPESSINWVRLRGLRIHVTIPDYDGLHVKNKIFQLEIDDCEFINGYNGLKADVEGRYIVKNSQFIKSNYHIYSNAGLRFHTDSGKIKVTIENCHVTSATYGVVAGRNSEVTVRNSVASHNDVGFQASGQAARLFIENSLVDSNLDYGVAAFSSGAVRVSNSTITNNRYAGILNSGGKAHTYGNNRIHHNGAATFGPVINANQQ